MNKTTAAQNAGNSTLLVSGIMFGVSALVRPDHAFHNHLTRV